MMARNSIYYGPRATVDQMTEARALCGKDAALVAKLDNLLSKGPNDRIMQKFIDYARDPNRYEGRFAVESMKGVNGFRGRRSSEEVKYQDTFTPIFFATLVTALLEAVLLAFFHADPDVHVGNYVWAGLIAFCTVAAAMWPAWNN